MSKNILIVVLSVALLGSLWANRQAYKYAKGFYLQLKLTRLHPLGLKIYPNHLQEGDIVASKQTAVFFGDSRADTWPYPTVEGVHFVNRAISGQTSVQVMHRYETHVRYLEPDVLILQVGINDITAIPLFPENKDDILRSTQQNIQTIVEQATADGATVVLTTIFPVAKMPPERMLFWSEEGQQAIIETNQFIHSLASEQVLIFDAYALLANEDGLLRTAYSQDELHLNEAGYAYLNYELQSTLAELSNQTADK